jgi:hypothetical protein
MAAIVQNIAFQALSLGVLGAYCGMIYAFRAQAAECLKNTVVFPRTSAAERAGTGNLQSFSRFPIVAMTLGVFGVGIAAVKVAAWLLSSAAFGAVEAAGIPGILVTPRAVPLWVAPAAVVAVALAVTCVAMVGMGILKAAGSLTLSEKFTDEIALARRNWMAAASILIVPLATVWTGMNPARDRVIAYMAAFVVVALAMLFVAHTLRGFVKQKVSLLVWFLYLCTVEVFPVCALVLAAVKNV